MHAERRLAAIMFTDIVGYTALMRRDEALALRMLEQNRAIQQPLILQHRGEWLKEMGDGVLAAFQSSTDALRCASAIVRACRADGIELRIGIHIGEVVFQGGDVFGDGVNIASRVESFAIPGSVLFTAKVHDDIRNKPEFQSVALGTTTFKNVDTPMEMYALEGEGLQVPPTSRTPDEMQGSGKRRVSLQVGIGIAILSLLVVVSLVLWWPGDGAGRGVENDAVEGKIVTLAALPFSNIAHDDQIGYFGFALVDEVISGLSYLQNVVVRPSASVRKYTDQVIVPEEIGQELSVQYILTGSYMQSGDSVRLNLELMNIENNTVMWRASVQERTNNIFELQDRVTKNVIEGLRIQFSGDERARMIKDVPTDPLAYEYYLKALAYPTSVEGNRLAIEMLRKSLELDSMFAPAYTEMGVRFHLTSNYSLMENRGDAIYQAQKYYERALELNDESLETLGNFTLLQTEMNHHDKAVELARRMIEINPKSPSGHFALGYVYRFAGMLEEAIDEMETAVKLDPNDNRFRSITVTYHLAGRYEDVLKAPVYHDGSGYSQSWRGFTYLKLGEYAKAKSELTEVMKIDPGSMLAIWCEGMLFYIEGRRASEEWMDELRRIEQMDDPESQYCWSLINVMHEDYDVFLELFEKAVDNGFVAYPAFQIDPLLDPLRDDPDFQRIMENARKEHLAFKNKYLPGS